MTIAMTDTRISNFNQLKEFLKATKQIEFEVQSKAEKYSWINSTLKKFKYQKLNKKKKGLVRKYIIKFTGASNLSHLLSK